MTIILVILISIGYLLLSWVTFIGLALAFPVTTRYDEYENKWFDLEKPKISNWWVLISAIWPVAVSVLIVIFSVYFIVKCLMFVIRHIWKIFKPILSLPKLYYTMGLKVIRKFNPNLKETEWNKFP